MNSANSRTLLLRSLFTGGVLLSFIAPLQAAKLTFNHTGGYVTSIVVDESLDFTLATNYVYSGIQIRIYDLFPAVSSIDTGNAYTGFSFGEAGSLLTNQTVSFAKWNATLGGNSTDGDLLIGMPGSYNLATGETFSFIGTGVAGASQSVQVPVPTSGTYSAYLVSQANGSFLSTPLSIEIVGIPAAVPEPASYASYAALGVLGVALGLRRRSRQG